MPMTGELTTILVAEWIREGVARGAKAMLITTDFFPWPPEPYPIFIGPDENIPKKFALLSGSRLVLLPTALNATARPDTTEDN